MPTFDTQCQHSIYVPLVGVSGRRNIILSNVLEERTIDPALLNLPTVGQRQPLATTRSLSQALIPGSRLVKVEVPSDVYNTELSCPKTVENDDTTS